MNTRALESFLESLSDVVLGLDSSSVEDCLADGLVVRHPLFAEPIEGKKNVLQILSHVLTRADQYEVVDVLSSESHFAVLHRFVFGEEEVDGVDYINLYEAGLVDALTVTWRPLTAALALQAQVGPVLAAPSKLS
jgi:hypothetical protein